MAKSKLSAQFSQALLNVAATLVQFQKTLESDVPLKAEEIDKLGNQWDAASRASSALGQHLDKLDDRIESPKLADRLRGLKNFFKDRNDLALQRVAARKWYKEAEQSMSKLWHASQMVMRSGDASKVGKAVQMCLETVRHLEADLPRLDKKVDALDAALQF